MNTQNKIYFLTFLLIISTQGYAQLHEEVLNVGKKKNPEVNVKNIQKIKNNPERYPPISEQPSLDKKEDTLTYSIINIPAVSDFQTSQLPPQPLNSDFNESYKDNYLKMGYGNRNTLLADAYYNYPIENNRVGIKFSALSTDGPKNQYDWKTASSHINTEAFYLLKLKTGKLHLAGNYTYNGSNYYGINAPEVFATTGMKLKQNTNQLSFKSDYDLYSNNYLDKASLQAGYWWDKFDSKESFVDIKAQLAKSNENASLLIGGLNFAVEADVLFNYTDTQFGLATKNKYSYITAGFSPVLKISSQGSYFQIGANMIYNGELKNNNSKFFFHPKAEFLFHAAKEISVFAGLNGGLKLHNMAELSVENPYLLSNQVLKPTNTLYKIYAGMKGDVGEGFKYEAEASFTKVEDFWVYMKNSVDLVQSSESLTSYNRSNTFNVAYDDGNIFTIKGSLQYFYNGDLNLGIEGEYNHYDLDKLKEAYHLPNFKIGLDGNYKAIDDKLRLSAKLFFTGERKSNYSYYDPQTLSVNEGIAKLDSYFDLNLSASYQLLNNLSLYVNGNNLFGKHYERFQGYKVLGTQILGGFIFKF